MKIGLFSDPHYSSQELTCGNRRNNLSLGKMRKALEHFRAEGCDRVICLGDLTDTEDTKAKEEANMAEIAALFKEFAMPITVVMGNHDAYVFTAEEFYALLGGCEPVDVHEDGKHLLFLDTNYTAAGVRYTPHGFHWDDVGLPDPDALRRQLAALEGDVYLFMHQNIDPAIPAADHRLANADRVCAILEQSGKVRAVYQGHYHWGNRSRQGGIDYITLPAMAVYDDTCRIIEV
ncbi:MAG: metallophosphoesterase [Clostridia bacterium]|nr:metallophosphoesterase [Clostridia bacterium]